MSFYRTGRRVARGSETGGATTHQERDDFARLSPEMRAALTVRLGEEAHGGARMPGWAIRQVEAEARAYADGLGRIAAERELEERGGRTEASAMLDEILEAYTPEGSTARAGAGR